MAKALFARFADLQESTLSEHTDHQGGYVLPAAISLRSMCLLRERDDGIIRLRASDIDTRLRLNTSDLSKV